MWTIGPSFPRLRPAAADSIMPIDLTSNVHFPKKPRMMKPLKIVLICWDTIETLKALINLNCNRITDLGNGTTWGIGRKHTDKNGGKWGKTQCPQHVRNIGDDITTCTFVSDSHKPGPRQPLNRSIQISRKTRTFMLWKIKTCEQLSRPKAVWLEDQQHCSLSSQKAPGQIPYFKSVIHVVPISTILATVPTWQKQFREWTHKTEWKQKTFTSNQTNKKQTHPPWPGIMSGFYEIPHWIFLMFHYVSMSHTIPGQISLPVYGLKVIILAQSRNIFTFSHYLEF